MEDGDELVSLSLKLPASGKEVIEKGARQRFRTLSDFLRLLIFRGLQAEDIELEEEAIQV